LLSQIFLCSTGIIDQEEEKKPVNEGGNVDDADGKEEDLMDVCI
jgi:hypothetical protein